MLRFLKRYFMPLYTSELDQFLQSFDETHPQLSTSQTKERAKFRAIYRLRDQGGEKVMTQRGSSQ